MPSSYHKAVQKAIVSFGGGFRKIKKIRESGRPLHITHPTKKKIILYNPDVRFELKNRKIIIFEIIDSQPEDKTIADITRSLLAKNVTQLYFIVKSEDMRDKIADIYDIILSGFADYFEGEKKKLFTGGNNILVIAEDIVMDEMKLQELISNNISI
ncbi:MAG: hypothetical protein KAT65_30280 [Methanophagales archaeon]|nr:hypothetical protein [Methanophagales archaeon]